MNQGSFWRPLLFIGGPLSLVAAGFISFCQAERPGDTKEPVYRVSKATPGTEASPVARVESQHPLVPAIDIANDGLKSIRANIKDYTATLVKRERISGELMDHEFATIKVRHERVENGKVVPFAVYLKFLKPKAIAGREVIWVKGMNNGKLVAHEGGGSILPSVWLAPDGFLAMRGQKYPITEVGMENLAVKLIERANQDMQKGPCQVQITPNFKVNGRNCTLLQVTHPEKDPKYLFHLARVYVDSELNIPIRYEAYLWPSTQGGKPELDEEYTYVDVKTNIGLTDADFDSNNPNYNF